MALDPFVAAPRIRAGLVPTRATLSNGLVVLARQTRKTPAVTIDIALRAGSVCDLAGAEGTMSLVARVLDRGTASRTSEQIADELDSRGISLSVGASRHLLSLVCTCLSSDFDAVMALIADIVMTASFPEREVALRKAELITAIGQDDDSPYVSAGEELMRALYGGAHPYGRRVKGTVDSVKSLTRDDLLRAYARATAPSTLTAAVVGDVEETHVVDTLERTLGNWRAQPTAEPALARPERAASRRSLVVPMMNKPQADVAYGFVSIARAAPSYYAYQLMNHILGQYALGGRLGDSIRERQGMAYYVSSALDASVVEGPLFIRAGVNPANVDRTIASIDAELDHARSEGFTQKELDDSRQYLIGSMPRALETNSGIATFLQTQEFFGLGEDYDLRLPGLLSGVSLDEVNTAARMLDPQRATIVVAGPYESAA